MTRSITFIFYYFTTLIALSVASCPKNGILDAEEGSCLFAVKFEDTFQNAQDYCSNYYGNLISIQSDDANEKVLSLGKTFANNTKFAWLGGKYDGTKITWIDETPAEFSNLQEGVPAGYLLLNLTSGKWTTANWNGLFPFVCRTQDASTEPPSCPPYAPCPTDWVYSQSLKFCYKAIFNVDFTEGDQNCRLMNSFLTSIHSDAENRFVNDLGKTGSPQTAWPQEPLIGGKRVTF